MLPNNPAKWPEYWRGELEERAAIMEFDGGMAQATAWEKAIEDCQRREALCAAQAKAAT